MPDERDFFGQLNTIKTLVESTCGDKWHVLAETAIPAAGEALYLLIIPSPQEVLENYLQPRPERSDPKKRRSGHGRRRITQWGHARWWQRMSFPDVDHIIANRLPGAEAFKGRKAGAAERWFWRGIDILDRVGWYWLLLDVGATFVEHWSSGIIESRFCEANQPALFSARSQPPDIGPDAPLWTAVSNLSDIENVGWSIGTSPLLQRQNTLIGVSGPMVVEFTGLWKTGGNTQDRTFTLRIIESHTSSPDTIHFSENTTVNAAGPYNFEAQVALSDCIALRIELVKLDGPTEGTWEDQDHQLVIWATPD